MDLIEQYNANLSTSEDGTISLVNKVLDKSFNRLVRRARVHMSLGYIDPAQRTLALLQEFRQLVPAYRPDRVDAYDSVLRNLFLDAQFRGIGIASELTSRARPGAPRLDVSIPLDATFAAAAQARGYLVKHGQVFAETSAITVAQGIAEGRSTDRMVRDMRTRLGVVKSRAENIVRTESLRAYNEASNTYYSAQGIEFVMYYATADDRACPICAPRAGQIYKRGTVRTPIHPRCVLGDTPVLTGSLIAATRALYYGNVVTIRTADGSFLRVTQNHPVATLRGWVKAEHLIQGDEVLSYSSGIPATQLSPNLPHFDQSPTTAEQVFETLRTSTGVATARVKPTAMDFHGEGALYTGDIEVVWPDGVLPFDLDSFGAQNVNNADFVSTNIIARYIGSNCPLDFLLLGVNAASSGVISVLDELLPLLERGLSHAEIHSLRPSAWFDPGILEPSYNAVSLTPEVLGQLLDTCSGVVTPTQVVQIKIESVAHPVPVYDFTTQSSSYIAGGIFTHNCRCFLSPWDMNLASMDPEYASMQKTHKSEVSRAVRLEPGALNRAAVFEQVAPTPIATAVS